MTTETDQILSQIPIAQLASRLGTDEQTAREAAEAALPTLLAGLTNEAQDPGRADGLATAVQRDHDPATLEAEDPLDRVDADEGDRIVSHLFGNDRADVEQRVSSAVGGQAGGLVQRVLPLLAPLVMSWLAGKMRGGSTARGGGIGDLLGGVLSGGGRGGASGGGLGDLLGGALGGGGGGLGDVLGQLGGKAGGGGGLDDLLGSILGSGRPAPRAERAGAGRDREITDVGEVFGDR